MHCSFSVQLLTTEQTLFAPQYLAQMLHPGVRLPPLLIFFLEVFIPPDLLAGSLTAALPSQLRPHN